MPLPVAAPRRGALQDEVEILQGPEDFRKLYDLIYDRVSRYRGTVCVSGVDETLFVKYLGGAVQPHMERMTRLVAQYPDIQMKILVREGNTNFVASDYAAYRWQHTADSPTAFYVFADYLALISFHGENAPKVILIHSAVFADSYRKQFMEQWRQARVPGEQKTPSP